MFDDKESGRGDMDEGVLCQFESLHRLLVKEHRLIGRTEETCPSILFLLMKSLLAYM